MSPTAETRPVAPRGRHGPRHALVAWVRDPRRRLLGPVVVAGAAVGALGALQVVDPNVPGHYPTCPFLAVTGLWCPGCGSLRMLHALGEGDLVAAFWLNPLGVLLLPVLVAYWVGYVGRALTGRPRGAPLHAGWVWAFLGVVVVYAVLRNLPGLEWLAPGPPPGWAPFAPDAAGATGSGG